MVVTPTLLTHNSTGTILSALSGATVYSLLWYARNYARDGEAFDPTQFLSTLIIGLIIAGVAWAAGVTLTEQGFAARMAVYIGFISLVEAALKTVWAEYYRLTGGRAGPHGGYDDS